MRGKESTNQLALNQLEEGSWGRDVTDGRKQQDRICSVGEEKDIKGAKTVSKGHVLSKLICTFILEGSGHLLAVLV